MSTMNIRAACQRLFSKGIWFDIPEIDEAIRKHSNGLQGTLLVYLPIGRSPSYTTSYTTVFRRLAKTKKLNYFIYANADIYQLYDPTTKKFYHTENRGIILQTPRIIIVKKLHIWESWPDSSLTDPYTIKIRL